jgi:hypothetical protein
MFFRGHRASPLPLAKTRQPRISDTVACVLPRKIAPLFHRGKSLLSFTQTETLSHPYRRGGGKVSCELPAKTSQHPGESESLSGRSPHRLDGSCREIIFCGLVPLRFIPYSKSLLLSTSEVNKSRAGCFAMRAFLAFASKSFFVIASSCGTRLNISSSVAGWRFGGPVCRLEEYWLAHKQYPDALAMLPDLPPHLNEEVLTGKPLHYQRNDDTYLLYSPSWDGKDRGGVGRKLNQAGDAYDWVWPGP